MKMQNMTFTFSNPDISIEDFTEGILMPVNELSDPVNHPAHYTAGNIEVIDFIEDQKLPYHLGNAVKYICRAGLKDPNKIEEDLSKAVWYINRYIEFYKKETTVEE